MKHRVCTALTFGWFVLASGALFGADGSTKHYSLPPNNLYLEDGTNFVGGISSSMFSRIISVAKSEYRREASANRETLVINGDWESSTVNANTQRSWGRVVINMYGGLARRPEMSPQGFALVLCHELGHAYGGRPYIAANERISAEGQSDYYGAGSCLGRILRILQPELGAVTPTYYTRSACNQEAMCISSLYGAECLGRLLSKISYSAVPNFETPDTYQTSTTLLDYPKTVQCRLDTYRHGVLGLGRPACWYAG